VLRLLGQLIGEPEQVLEHLPGAVGEAEVAGGRPAGHLATGQGDPVAQQQQEISVEAGEQQDEVESVGEGPAVGLVAADLLHAVVQELLDLLAGGVKGGEQILLAALVGEDQPLEGLELQLRRCRRGGQLGPPG
jgi:hypothetical protein